MEYVVKIIADVLAALYQTAGASFCWRHLSCASICLAGNREPVQWLGMDPSVRTSAGSGNIFPGILCKYDAVRTLLCGQSGNPLDHVSASGVYIIMESFTQRILKTDPVSSVHRPFVLGSRKKENIIRKKVFRMS